MKRLKIILQHKLIYFVVLFVALISYFVSSNVEHNSVYATFSNEKFVITGITLKDYGVKIALKGKEKVLGFIYYKDDEEKKLFCSKYKLGDSVFVTGDKMEISNNTVPDTFNYKHYLVSNEIYSVVNITNIERIKENDSVFYYLKNILFDRGKKLEKSYPYISSLIFGNNSYLDDDVLLSYRENGISHLFAISGLHISIFIMLISVLLDKIKVPEIIKSIILICFLLFYMFLTDFSMSVLRGAIFTILLIVNKLLKLEIPTVNLLLLTLSIILFNNPLNLNNVGLLYSFLVTLFLIVFSSLLNSKSKIYSLFMISFVAFLVSYPITVNNFNQVNFLSIIYNLFFVPYVSSILLPFTLLSYVVPALDNILYILIRIIEFASQFLNSIDIFKVSMCKMNVLLITVYFVIICKLFIKFDSKKVKYFVFLCVFLIIHYFLPLGKEDYVLFFDVGQGDSSLISVDNSYTLIDTGGRITYDDKEYDYKIARNKLIPYFKANGIRKIDNLVLTHGDADHMREASYLVNNIDVGKVIFNCGEYNVLEKELIKELNNKGIRYFTCVNNINIGDYKLEILNTGVYDNENDSSSVIYFKYNDYKFLFMGDASVERERDILEKYKLSNIDFLKVGHHGSNTSSGDFFINNINPKYSVISVGKDNRYGHPKEDVLDILKNSKIYRTDVDGSIEIKLNKDGYKIKTYVP